jgi:hypothetical protein
MAAPQQIFLQYVCPALGNATALLLFLSPLAAVRRVNATKHLGVRGCLMVSTVSCLRCRQ